MKAIVVDDDRQALDNMMSILQPMEKFTSVKDFTDPLAAGEYLKKHYVDVAFLDIRMPGIDGIKLAKEITLNSPDTNVIFVTTYTHYLVQAFSIHASGYIVKPATYEKVLQEMKNLRFPPKFSDLGIRVQTFGPFEVFHDSRNLEFKNLKAKEVMAILVDKLGEETTLREVASILWPERAFDIAAKKELGAIMKDLRDTLAEVGAENVVVDDWGKVKVDRSSFRCDLYDLLEGKPVGMTTFNGCYMKNYDWAEDRLSQILRKF